MTGQVVDTETARELMREVLVSITEEEQGAIAAELWSEILSD